MEGILKIKVGLILSVLATTSGAVTAGDASEFSKNSSCPRPPVGSVAGACEVRNKRAAKVLIDNTQSPYVIHKWWSCLQSAKHLPCGCNADAQFIRAFIFEWKQEIDANLASLRKLLSPRDHAALNDEQNAWERAVVRGQKSRDSSPQPFGSMYLIYSVIADEAPYSERAIELACRVEKFSVPHTAEPSQ